MPVNLPDLINPDHLFVLIRFYNNKVRMVSIDYLFAGAAFVASIPIYRVPAI